jgi:excinuclease ABC subunit A
MTNKEIVLKKVRVHNLKEVDLSLKTNQLIVFTGVSGSGKSSLAFDTIYIEGQRRYIESLSVYARRHLGDFPKPDAALIQGISPTIAIEQKTAGRNPRSTVGTMTGIYDFLRVLYARIGTPHCPVSLEPVAPQSAEQILSRILEAPEGTKAVLLAPFVKDRRGAFKEECADLLRKGFTRIRLDGEMVELSEEILIDGSTAHTIDLVIDRLRIAPQEKGRIAEGVQTALEAGNGVMRVWLPASGEEILYSRHAFSQKSGLSYSPLEPQDFSFNHPAGMCPACQGLGGACPACKGARIRPYPAAALVGGKRIAELTALSVCEALAFVRALQLTKEQRLIAEELVKETSQRLSFLVGVGLHYLSLERTAPTLSGGEAQRVRLAAQIGSGLVGATYVLDEPSIGLHPRDNRKLLEALRALRDQGNTVIVVEHDEETIREADYLVDVGPRAGKEGGRIVAQGDVHALMACPESLTGAYLAKKRAIPVPRKRRKLSKQRILIERASHHNLKDVTAEFPIGVFIAVTGVSGSGKSSLITDVLYPALSNALHQAALPVGAHGALKGIEAIDKVIAIDQTPIGRTPRSNAATYTKVFDEIRTLFGQLPESRAAGYTASRFSFNVKEGSCPHCCGMGMIRIDMDFLEDEWTACSYCDGRRFDAGTLSVQYKGKTIHDVLELSVREAHALFDAFPKIRSKLETLMRVGLDYLKIGQPSPTLSGGEAQRIKLAKELCRPDTGKTFYVLDEPTTGLHFHDIHVLNQVLQALVDKGNTVLVIEHNMDLVKTADWILDLGPEGGSEGGRLVASGTPEEVARLETPTACALRPYLFPASPPLHTATPAAEAQGWITVQGAAQNNLRNVNARIPLCAITVCTGPSGSGKSSFAFETLYAEGQRRYIESMSFYARQFVQQMPKPKVERVDGIPAAIAIEQKHHAGNPRSTVGTLTEAYDYLRILYAHLGVPHCPETGEKIQTISKQYVLDQLSALPAGTRVHILAPLDHAKRDLEKWQRLGYLRVRLDRTYYELDEKIPWEIHKTHTLSLVIDRLPVGPGQEGRLLEAIDRAADLTHGALIADVEGEDRFFNLSFAVPSTGKSYPPITPHTFSFNTEQGMCPDCQGLGFQYGVDLTGDRWIRQQSAQGLIEQLWKGHATKTLIKLLTKALVPCGVDPGLPFAQCTSDALHLFFNGAKKGVSWHGLTLRWTGIHTALARLSKSPLKRHLLHVLRENTCPSCCGTRLNPLARHVRLNGLTLPAFCSLPIDDACEKISCLTTDEPFLVEPLAQLQRRLRFLKAIGLGYLSLDRTAPTLSGGEAQRIRLAAQLGSGLAGCLYVLDEPTIGLHPHDNALLNASLKELCALGNTLLLVEHDPLTLAIADYVLEFGPQAGAQGGEIVAQGPAPKASAPIPPPKMRRSSASHLAIERASLHNLRQVSAAFPIGAFSCVTGVSGSGKSTLIGDLLVPAVRQSLGLTDSCSLHGASVTGISTFEALIALDQNPIGRTVRADVTTYTDLLAPLRAFFSTLPEARTRGLLPKHFSANHRAGMCTHCTGLGFRSVELQFLPPVKVTCEACRGYRLNPLSLQVAFKGKHLGQVLQMSVEAARAWLPPIPKAIRILDTLMRVGLGYLTLGQEVASLSGGEAQRLRLSAELAKRSRGRTLYVFDEPTIGLHSSDVAVLLPIFHALVDKGHTLIVIEHNLDVIGQADYVLDLGPEAGAQGGTVVASGTPEEIAAHPSSYTGAHLRTYFSSDCDSAETKSPRIGRTRCSFF